MEFMPQTTAGIALIIQSSSVRSELWSVYQMLERRMEKNDVVGLFFFFHLHIFSCM